MPHSPPTTEFDDLVKVSPPPAHIPIMPDIKVKVEQIDPSYSSQPLDAKDEKPMSLGEADVQKMFEDTVRRVREQSDRIQTAAKPYADRTRSLAETRPVFFTYLTIFAVLSFIPVCCFIGFLVSSTLFVVGVAAVGICLSVLFLILLASIILLPTLFFTSFIALTILLFLLSLFLAHRLYLHISASSTTPQGTLQPDYNNLSRGVRSWLDETASRIPEYSFDLSSLRLGGAGQAKVASGYDTPRPGGTGDVTEVEETPRPGDVTRLRRNVKANGDF